MNEVGAYLPGGRPGSRIMCVAGWLLRNPDGRLDRRLLFVFLFINGLVLFNAILHEPTIQYDGARHLKYVATL